MHTIEVSVYKFAELSPAAKQRAIEWYRAGAAEDWQPRRTNILCVLTLLGFDVPNDSHGQPRIHYEISYSQSDGAGFVGQWRAQDADIETLLTEYPDDSRIAEMATAVMHCKLQWPFAGFEVRYSGRHPMRGLVDDIYVDARDPDSGASIPGELYKLIKRLRDDVCTWMYETLREDYEFVTSEEACIEGIEANDYDFDEHGNCM